MQCVKWKISSTIQYKINAQGSRKQCEGSFGLRPNPQPPPPKSSDCATAFLEPVPGEMGIAGGGYSGGVDTTELGGPRDGADGAGGIAGGVGGAPRSVALLGAGSLGAVAACGCRGGGLALGGVTGPHAGPPGQRGGLSWPDQSR